eukprot:8952071-Ditylum_brightwellii.AAC.1
MLGVKQAATMNMDSEFETQSGKTYKFGCAIVASPLQWHECYLSYRTIYILSDTYGFPVCAGTSTHILRDTRPIPHLEGNWVKALREGMNAVGAQICHKYKWTYLTQR